MSTRHSVAPPPRRTPRPARGARILSTIAAAAALAGGGSTVTAQGLDPVAANSARAARSMAVEAAVRDGDPAAREIASRAGELINNIRDRLDACGDEGMLGMQAPREGPMRTGTVARRPHLTWNPRLASAARAHSIAMSREQFFDHVDPRGRTVGNRARDAGYRWRVVGENLAAGQDSIDEAVRGWLLSTSHCRNLIDARFTEFGIARVDSADPSDPYGSYWTLVLGVSKDRQFASR